MGYRWFSDSEAVLEFAKELAKKIFKKITIYGKQYPTHNAYWTNHDIQGKSHPEVGGEILGAVWPHGRVLFKDFEVLGKENARSSA